MSRAVLIASIAAAVIGCRAAEEPSQPAAATTATEAVSTGDAAPAPPFDVIPEHASDSIVPDVTGAYFAMDPLPAEFAELDHLLLATIDENAAPAPLNGFLRPKKRSAADYTLVSPKLDDTRLTFATSAVDGVHYTFTGEFDQLSDFPRDPPGSDVAVLAGTLTKVRNGQTVATTPVRFRYEAGG